MNPQLYESPVLNFGSVSDHPILALNLAFGTDKFTKYVGWSLFDASPAVRRVSLESINMFCAKSDVFCRLEAFWNRFEERLQEMINDVDDECVILAIQLMELVLKMPEDSFADISDEQCLKVSRLMFHTHRHVAISAGSFAFQYILDKTEENSEVFTSRGQRLSASAAHLKEFAEFIFELKVHNHR